VICRSRKLDVPDLVLLEAQRIADSRGSFMEMYKRSEFSKLGISEHFVQDNYSRSSQHVLRGLHYQKAPKAQAKLVTVLRGEIFDVAVDIRKGSPTYGRWTSVVLSSDKPAMVYVPAGFAHGFCVLSEEADVLYKVSEEYAPELDRGIVWSDSDVGIRWPLTEPIVSAKDARLPRLQEADNEFVYERKE
jgi:dTDP-4-dehydrorhamnose 3,5-epimerase